MTEAPNWRGGLEEVLNGIHQELEGPEPGAAVLQDLKVMLDNTRNVIQAFGMTSNEAEYLKALRGIRVRRTAGVCQNLRADITAGRVPAETLGLAELREILADVMARLNISGGA